MCGSDDDLMMFCVRFIVEFVFVVCERCVSV